MIGEIALAIGAAKKAFELLESGMNAGKQVGSMMDHLGEFYDAKEQVQEIRESSKRTGYSEDESVNAYALRVIQAEADLEAMESSLKKSFMAAGRTPQYQKMLRVRAQERDRRAAAQRELLKMQREKLQRQRELKNVIIALGALALCAGSAIYIAAVAVG
mgnify:CR=1 FL=1